MHKSELLRKLRGIGAGRHVTLVGRKQARLSVSITNEEPVPSGWKVVEERIGEEGWKRIVWVGKGPRGSE